MTRNLLNGFFILALGILLLLSNLDVLDFWDVFHTFWPLIFIIWGVSLVLKKGSGGSREYQSPVAGTSESLHDSKLFGNLFVRAESREFKGGHVSTVFGDCDLDLSGAQFADGEHELSISGVFGDTTVILPPGAAVLVSVSKVLGDSTILGQRREGIGSDSLTFTPDYEKQTRRLKIKVSKVFGSTKIG